MSRSSSDQTTTASGDQTLTRISDPSAIRADITASSRCSASGSRPRTASSARGAMIVVAMSLAERSAARSMPPRVARSAMTTVPAVTTTRAISPKPAKRASADHTCDGLAGGSSGAATGSGPGSPGRRAAPGGVDHQRAGVIGPD